MTYWLKKILVLLPVLLLTVFFLHDRYHTMNQAGTRRLLFLALTILVLYAWILAGVFSRKQQNFMDLGIESSFYVYIFMVLTLTGYFILFREISLHDWWHNLTVRVEKRQRVNFELFKVFDIYRLTDKQVLGNLVMLLPLGIYLPLLYKGARHFFKVILISMLASIGIELLQLITSYRSTDIDDVLLNTAGAGAGFIIYIGINMALHSWNRVFGPPLLPADS